MRLKRLECFGFKSFADRMDFEFVPGLTGIVGPNGCGKSNVVDAIRWVFGEQRPTQLRGSEMTDVIFKGTSNRDQLGFAEVTIVIDNEGGGLPLEYSEVSFTRRLFRTGESEYLLNRQPARLKDIRELLLDTGLGVHSYTILEQGKIDAILAANPVERRAIFEEASGISKFRLRRKEAMRKIEQVQQNLLRLNDLLAELESGIRSLKIQASKVRRYREFQDKLRDLKINLSLHFYRARSLELVNARSLREQRDQEIAHIREAREKIEAEIKLIEQEAAVQAAEISRQNSSLEKAKFEEAQAADRINNLEVRMSEWAREKSNSEERKTAIENSIQEKEAERERLIGELEKSREELASAQRTLEEKQEKYRTVSQTARELVAELQKADAEVLDLLHLRTEAQNRRIDLEVKSKALENDRERFNSRKSEMAQTIDWRKARESKLLEEHTNLEQKEQEIEDKLQAVQTQREALAAEFAEKEKRFYEIEQKLSALQSRQQVLKDLAENRDGVDRGAKAALEVDPGLSLLADRLQIDLRYARALETALIGRSQCVIAFDARTASSAMSQLRQSQGGRASFALAGNARPPLGSPIMPQVPGLLGRLADEVRCEASLKPLIEQWIGDCLIVESIERGEALAQRYPEFRFVTAEGDLFSYEMWIGGEMAKESGPISRRSLLEALDGELHSLRSERDQLQLTREELRRAASQLQGEEDRLEGQKGLIARESAARNAGVEEARVELARLEEETILMAKEFLENEKAIIEAAELLSQFTGEWQALEQRFQFSNDNLKRLHAAKNAQELVKEECAREESEARLLMEKLRGSEQNIQSQREMLAEAVEEHRHEVENLLRTIEEIAKRKENADGEVAALHQQRAVSLETRAQLEQVLKDLRVREDALETAIREKRDEIESQGENFEHLMSVLSEAKLEEQKLEMTRAELAARIREEFQLELAELVETATVDPNFDPQASEKEIAETKEKADRLGSLNLDAIRELEEKEQRFQSLTGQKTDLEEAKKLLQETIQKIDEESRERFSATFAAVREQFQVIFRQLFRGGKADLVLEEGVDLLEAGIVIQAKPPGKELRNIDLLSGGERTLTALALLFSLFRSKPSPFCLLDEVDAALDDANVERFLNVLAEFTKDSQFVLVTHNKRTMSACNLLYGITMQDNGVSKKVAVDLGKEGEQIRFVSPGKAVLEKQMAQANQTQEAKAPDLVAETPSAN